MNFDWNTALQIGGCCSGMRKGGGCETKTKSHPRRDEDATTTHEGDRQETELRNRSDGGA